jgi:hypothetical protein
MTRPRKTAAPVALPREANPTRVASQYLRSRRLAVAASRAARLNPNPGTIARRNDRTLAALALRAKVAFLAVAARPLRGAARLSALKGAARKYRAALARWEAYYRGRVAL